MCGPPVWFGRASSAPSELLQFECFTEQLKSCVLAAVALAFKAQIVDSVPMTEHDRPVDVLVMADGVHRVSERGQEF